MIIESPNELQKKMNIIDIKKLQTLAILHVGCSKMTWYRIHQRGSGLKVYEDKINEFYNLMLT